LRADRDRLRRLFCMGIDQENRRIRLGAPLPSAPPCIRHLRRPVTGADLHGAPRSGAGSCPFSLLPLSCAPGFSMGAPPLEGPPMGFLGAHGLMAGSTPTATRLRNRRG
jgi:hypothetical protein